MRNDSNRICIKLLFLFFATAMFSCSAKQPASSSDNENIFKKGYHTLVTDLSIAGVPVYRIQLHSNETEFPQIVAVDIAGQGSTPVALMVRMQNGKTFNLLGSGDARKVAEEYESRLKANEKYAGNRFFTSGAMGALFPLANRLTGKKISNEVIEATVLGQTVRMPLNNGLGAGQTPQHLHGLIYDQPTQATHSSNSESAKLISEFTPGFERNFWPGQTQLKITHTLINGGYNWLLEAKNSGATPTPMGGGSHPYFTAPSGDPRAIKLYIPAKKLVEIDGYKNVLPTGKIVKVTPGSNYDFNKKNGVHLNGRYLDNLWVDLQTDRDGYAFAEFIDEKAKLKFRMTALTKNIIGIQVYAPKPESHPELGVFAAIEFVTNLPDPREALWKKTKTGMKLVQPGDTFSVGQRIEVMPL